VSTTAVFAREPKRLVLAKSAMAVVDAAAVIATAFRAPTALFAPTAFLAAGMFVWHTLENVVWPRRLAVRLAPVYPSGLVWPNLAYSGVLCAASAQWWLGGGPAAGISSAVPASVGLALFAAGVWLRLAAFSTLGATFLAAPAPEQRLSREGLYRWLSHPASVGFFLISIGSAAALSSSWALAATALLCTPALVVATHLEARARARSPGHVEAMETPDGIPGERHP
jgi:protein-S-isoprenylcysteine O-methyltransferase Ste14